MAEGCKEQGGVPVCRELIDQRTGDSLNAFPDDR